VATASLADPVIIAGGGIGTFDGLRGAHRDGSTWRITRTLLIDIKQAPTTTGHIT
jgi:hypothetical protein